LDIDPKFEDALYYKGDVLFHIGNYTEALTYLDKALAIDPNDKDALDDKVLVLQLLGAHSTRSVPAAKTSNVTSTTTP
jgi:tetratricopeptide (TPR) repeat protein